MVFSLEPEENITQPQQLVRTIELQSLELSLTMLVVSSDASENPNQHISDAVKSGDVGKLRDLVQFVLDEADSETAEKLAEYTRRDSNPQPSVPKTDALSS